MENGQTKDAEGGVQYKGEANQEALAVTVVSQKRQNYRRRADGAWGMLKCQW